MPGRSFFYRMDRLMDYEPVLKKIRPSEEEVKKTQEIAKKIISKLNKLGYEAVLVGSRARGTFLANSRDMDIFFFFPQNLPREKLEKEGISVAKKVLRGHRVKVHYAEHPYAKTVIKGITVELVPCYKVKDKIISAVDRTPLHNEFLLHNLRPMHRDEVLLLKQFLRNIDAYGAEHRVHGFSGYLCELLILYYDTFDNLVKNAAEWKHKTVIDIKGHCKNPEKFKEPLVVIDPVDPDRNVAAAVSRKVLSRFIQTCRDFLKKPGPDFFFKKKEVNVKKEASGRNLVGIVFKYPKETVEEIVWAQLEKLARILKDGMERKGFEVLGSSYWTDEKSKCAVILDLNTTELGAWEKHRGPEVWDRENCERFIEKNAKYFFRKSRVYAWRKRDCTKAEECLKKIIESEELPSRLSKNAKKAKVKKGLNIPREALQEYFRWYG